MADFSNVVDQLNENKEANKTSLSNVNKNLAFRLDKINDSLRMMTLANVAANTISNNSNNDMSVPTPSPKPEEDSKPTGFGSTEIGKILKNDIGGGLKNLTGKITDPLTSLAKSIPGLNTIGKISKSLGKSAIGAVSPTKKAEKDAEAASRADKDTTLLEKIFRGTTSLIELAKEGLKKSAFALGAGLGALVALLFSPLTILVAFFKSVGKELAYLKTVGKKIAGSKFFKVIGDFFGRIGKFVGKFTGLTKLKELGGGGIDKIIGSVKGFFGNIKNSLANFAKAKGFVLGVDGKAVVKTNAFVKSIVNGVTTVKNFFAGIGKTIKAVLAPITSGVRTGFSFVTKFAAGFGTVLGKIFLPITILMSAFDFITGFIDGFKIDGIMGGLEAGLAKLFGNLIGIPLDLLKQGVAFILGKFGFDEVAESLKTFSFKNLIQKGIGGLFDMVKFVINQLIEAAAKIVSVVPFVGDEAAAGLRNLKFDTSKKNVQEQIKAQKLNMEKTTDGRAQEMTESKLTKEAKAAATPVIVNNSNVIDNSSKSSSSTNLSVPLQNNNPAVASLNLSY